MDLTSGKLMITTFKDNTLLNHSQLPITYKHKDCLINFSKSNEVKGK